MSDIQDPNAAAQVTSIEDSAPLTSADKGKGKGKAAEPAVEASEEDDDDDEDDSEDESEEEEEDLEDLDGVDPGLILASGRGGRRARQNNIDYSSEEALSKAGLQKSEDAEEEEDEVFKADDSMDADE